MNQEFVQKISFSNYYFEEINFDVFFYLPRRLIAVASKKSRICTKKISFSNYYFEEINFDVFFYFPRRASIGAICLLQSRPKNQEFVQIILFLTTTLRKSILMCFSIFSGGRQQVQSAYCSRFQKIKNLYQKISFSNYYFEEINFDVFFYFPRRTSIGAICLLQSLPENQ